MKTEVMDPLTTVETARLLGVTTVTVYRWVRSGRLAAAGKLPGKTGAYLFDRAAIESMVGATC